MSIFPSWNGRITPPTVRTKAIAVTTVFLLEVRSPPMPCGRTRTPTPRLRKSRDTSRSIPTESMKSRSNFQPRANRQRAVAITKDEEIIMSQTIQERNKALVLDAFDTLFNKRDYAAAEKYWSPDYIQHSAHIEPGRDGLFNLIRNAPDTLRYEHQLIVAEGDYVIVHGRFSGIGRPVAWVAADIVRIENGRLAEHWDVLQDEATKAESKSGLPMFGDRFTDRKSVV